MGLADLFVMKFWVSMQKTSKFLRDKKFEMEQDGREMTEDIAESLILDRFVGRP